MEHIQKYKIEDESLDDQSDNFIYSQNSYANNIPSKNNNNISKNVQNKTIKATQPKVQLSDLGVSVNKKNFNQNKSSNFTKSENLQKINNKNNITNINNINNNFKLSNNINTNNLIKQNPQINTPIKDIKNININNINNNPMVNSEMNFTNIELNEDLINIEGQNIDSNQLLGRENEEIKNTDIDLDQENKDNNLDNDYNLENDNNDNAYHHVQIIDEDVENFKRRLDIMMKNFRTDTLKDFMAIKRNLLIEQKTCIENEKQKCDALLSSKSDLIEHLKDDLAKTQKALNNQIIIKEKLVEILFKKNHDKLIKNKKSLAFHGVLLKYHNKKKIKKDKIKKMRKKHWDNYKITFFKNLKQNWKDMKIYKIVSVKEKACDDKLNEMAQYYGKEINDLRNKLNEANLTIEQSNQSKAQIQENLKKVLMRGVMAMNMEAMNVLDKDVLPKTDISAIADNIMNNVNNISNITGGNINNNIEGCFSTVNQGIINNNSNNNSNIKLNQTSSGVNIKVGVNEDNNNLMATVIPANQSFQPNSVTFKNNNLNNNISNNTLLNNTNPINKDSYWKNAPSVPVDIQKNIISTENKINREAMVMTINNNNILNNIDTENDNQGNDFDDELNSRTYNISPMNPIDTKYFNNNHSLLDNNAKLPQYNYNNNNYYDEMQQNMLGIKNEFSIIKQNQSSMMDEDSLNSYAIGNKNIIQNNINTTSNNSKPSLYATTNNTSNNIRSNSKKGNNNNHIGNKKGNAKNSKVPVGGKNNSMMSKKGAINKNKK